MPHIQKRHEVSEWQAFHFDLIFHITALITFFILLIYFVQLKYFMCIFARKQTENVFVATEKSQIYLGFSSEKRKLKENVEIINELVYLFKIWTARLEKTVLIISIFASIS